MTKQTIIERTVEVINKLPEQQIQEIKDYAEFLLQRIGKQILSEEVSKLNLSSSSYKFLEEDEDLYTVNDLKETYRK